MNKIERIVYDCVKSSPALKFFIRNVYQTVFDLLPHPQNQFAEKYCYKEDYFFGFHDCTPFSDDDTKVLANHTTIPLRMPKEGETRRLELSQGLPPAMVWQQPADYLQHGYRRSGQSKDSEHRRQSGKHHPTAHRYRFAKRYPRHLF